MIELFFFGNRTFLAGRSLLLFYTFHVLLTSHPLSVFLKVFFLFVVIAVFFLLFSFYYIIIFLFAFFFFFYFFCYFSIIILLLIIIYLLLLLVLHYFRASNSSHLCSSFVCLKMKSAMFPRSARSVRCMIHVPFHVLM